MRKAFLPTFIGGINQAKLTRMAALAAIVALAEVLYFTNLQALGYANHYYAAAVESMLQSWPNFFYLAAEPGGSVSVDKPPVGLWLQAISAYFFGVNGFAVLLPEILAGLLAIIVIYHLVRRSFGTTAGLLAALALAFTPVMVATNRNNTIDSPLILTLLLAAWAFVKATETSQRRYMLLGAFLIGLGFNIKMLEAYLPLPTFYALYLLGASDSLGRKLVNLGVATVLIVAVSLSWAVAVDLTPANQRPYVGSTENNSVMELIIGYNGIERLTGLGSMRSGAARVAVQIPRSVGNGSFQPPRASPAGLFPRSNSNIIGLFQWLTSHMPSGFSSPRPPGLMRLFTVPLSKETSWLLPFGLFGLGFLAFRTPLRWPVTPKHQAFILWGGWLLTSAVFFSIAGFFHEYYLTILAIPLAPLVGIGVAELWAEYRQRPWLAIVLLLLVAGVTLKLQTTTTTAFIKRAWWLPFTEVLFFGGAVLLVAGAIRSIRQNAMLGFTFIVAALLLTPGIWSELTTRHASPNQSLPSAYDGKSLGPVNRGGLQINQMLLDYLEPRTQGIKYLMMVPSSMQGSDYVLATGRPVLYAGGFMGQDQVISSTDLAQLVAHGKLRFVYWDTHRSNGFGLGSGREADISKWIITFCQRIPGFDVATHNSGTPDGTRTMLGNTVFMNSRDMHIALYDCGDMTRPNLQVVN